MSSRECDDVDASRLVASSWLAFERQWLWNIPADRSATRRRSVAMNLVSQPFGRRDALVTPFVAP